MEDMWQIYTLIQYIGKYISEEKGGSASLSALAI